MQESIGKSEIRPSVKPQPLKISVRNFAHVITSETSTIMQISVQIGSVGASSKVLEIYRLYVFSDRPVFSRARAQVEPLDRFYAL